MPSFCIHFTVQRIPQNDKNYNVGKGIKPYDITRDTNDKRPRLKSRAITIRKTFYTLGWECPARS